MRLTLKNHHQEKELYRHRLLWLGAMMILLWVVLLLRLIHLQSFEHERFTTLSDQNIFNIIPTEPPRGAIYDRNGIVLANNTPIFSLEITPELTPHVKQSLGEIEKILHLSKSEIDSFNKIYKQHRRFQPITVRMKLSEIDIAKLSVDLYRLPGVSITPHLIRQYPLGELLPEVVGYVGKINEKELNMVPAHTYTLNSYIGKTGIEKYDETFLRGTLGYQQVESDANGRVIRTVGEQTANAGDDLYLTIDSQLQKAAKEALGKDRGAVVAIDPRNGEVLALVSTPSYDPNLFVSGISYDNYQLLQEDTGQPLYNRALRAQYPPASTIKPFMAFAGLFTKTTNAYRTVYDSGEFRLKDSRHIYHDWRPHGHGSVNLIRAITVSCDIYFYDLAVKMGIQKIHDVLQHFSYGQLTGIDLQDELTGILPSPAWKQKNKGQAWYPGDTVNIGVGQGFMLATPLQMAVAVATLANGGTRFHPKLLLKRHSSDNHFYLEKPDIAENFKMQKKDWQLVREGMRNVIDSEEGTGGHFGRDTPYTVAAKTGTAQVYSVWHEKLGAQTDLPYALRNNSLFIAFAPVENPEIAIAVMVEHNPLAASNVARRVLDHYLLPKYNRPTETETKDTDQDVDEENENPE